MCTHFLEKKTAIHQHVTVVCALCGNVNMNSQSYMRLLLETALLELSNDTQEIQNQHEDSEILGMGQCFVG